MLRSSAGSCDRFARENGDVRTFRVALAVPGGERPEPKGAKPWQP